MAFRDELKTKVLDFDSIRLRLASPEVIRAWSYGEVKKPETINYRTQKPEKDGLFDEHIFGPTKDWECYCGKYKKIRYKGIICDKCGVEVTHSLVRRERMGHIELAASVAHIWFLRGVPSKIGLVLDMGVQSLEKVIYFANFIITRVDEGLRAQAVEQLREEYKSKRKQIEGEWGREVERIKQRLGTRDQGLGTRVEPSTESAAALENLPAYREASKIRDRKLAELESDREATDRELKELAVRKIISEQTYHEWSLRFGHLFEAEIGAEAIRRLLQGFDVASAITAIEGERPHATGARAEKMARRLKLLRSLQTNRIKPEWMVVTTIPVIPPDLRPMVPLDGGRFATSDLNDLYRRVINRNNRLHRLLELAAPEVIVRNEKRMLQEAVDALIDNSARQSKTAITAAGKKRQLKSLADILKGKQGRFRQNLLGKRTDYSGRSVIVVGPHLKLDQCGLPKRMALELFKPFVISKLIRAGLVHNIRSANRFIESGRSEVWDLLEEVTLDAHVLLNRAPTLHRLGIQAFRPVLIEGKAIQIHPLVCTAFNADFDGDQMAVHVPLSEEAKTEARELMLSKRNLLKPATGDAVATPNKDVAWGCYYLTLMLPLPADAKPKNFWGEEEARYAYDAGKIGLQEPIRVRLSPRQDALPEMIETTVGRTIFNAALPPELRYVNDRMDAKKLADMTRSALEQLGKERAAELLDDLKELGFHYVTKAGYSWGMHDLPELSGKPVLLADGEQRIDEIESQYREGLLTVNERHSKVIEVWTDVKDKVTKHSKELLPRDGSVFSIIDSGARGSWGQLTQMVGMKGLVANPAGDIIELPVKASFKAGFDVLEYFISTHGTRKGLSDTALRTANAGYLTRRLVDVAQDVVIREEDCGDEEGVTITQKDSQDMGEPLTSRILGRFTHEAITHPKTGEEIVGAGALITEAHARIIAKLAIESVRVRSVLSCKFRKGMCQKCYGYDLGHNNLAPLGLAGGIVAAQSIGEPGTQLTMRTFHTGGVAGLDITQGLPRVEELFEARPPKNKAITTDVGGIATIEEGERKIVEGPTGKRLLETGPGGRVVRVSAQGFEEEKYRKEKGDELRVQDGTTVVANEPLFTKKSGEDVLAKHDGAIEVRGNEVVVKYPVLLAKEFVVPPGYVLIVKSGQAVTPGDPLTEGNMDLHELFRTKGRKAVERYMLKEIQQIYTSQGQKLNDKHVEIIIRQMFSRISVADAGDTELLPGETVERAEFEAENGKARAAGKKLATGEPLFLGISRVALSTQSFLSAASFMETARVLINAAISGKADPLEGLKENVIIGRLVPAGTGFHTKKRDAARARARAERKEEVEKVEI